MAVAMTTETYLRWKFTQSNILRFIRVVRMFTVSTTKLALLSKFVLYFHTLSGRLRSEGQCVAIIIGYLKTDLLHTFLFRKFTVNLVPFHSDSSRRTFWKFIDRKSLLCFTERILRDVKKETKYNKNQVNRKTNPNEVSFSLVFSMREKIKTTMTFVDK